jgi:hypothetical protein
VLYDHDAAGMECNGGHWNGSRIERPSGIGLLVADASQIWYRGKFHGSSLDSAIGYPVIKITGGSSSISFTSSQMTPLKHSTVIELGSCQNTVIVGNTFAAVTETADLTDRSYIRFIDDDGRAYKITIVSNDFKTAAALDYDIDAAVAPVSDIICQPNSWAKGINGELFTEYLMNEGRSMRWVRDGDAAARVVIFGDGQLGLGDGVITDLPTIRAGSGNPDLVASGLAGSIYLSSDNGLYAKWGANANQYWVNLVPNANNTASRPTNPKPGLCYYDTSLNKPIWWTTTGWRDATGALV